MRRRRLAWLLGLALSGALLAPAAALATQTQTIHFTTTSSTADTNPCSGATGTLTIASSGVVHLTTLDNGTVHVTETITSTATFVPDDPNQPTYTGHFTEWDGFNTNAKNATGTVTFDAVAHGSDGSLLKLHTLDHLTVNANGTVTSSIEADKLTCPQIQPQRCLSARAAAAQQCHQGQSQEMKLKGKGRGDSPRMTSSGPPAAPAEGTS